jgi:polar amino acid transport system substrate-binding protein
VRTVTIRILLAAVLSGVLVATAAAAPPQTVNPGQLTIGVALPSEGFQVGVVRGSEVIYAQGLEIDLARALALRLQLDRTAFLQSRFDRLFSAGPKPWDVAIAQITITPDRRRATAFTRAYMSVDQGVLAAQTLRKVPTRIVGLRPLRICALGKSTGALVAQGTIVPTRPARLVGNVESLMLDLQTGRCEAVVYDAPALGTLKDRAPDRYGPFVGVIPTGEKYGIAVPLGSALRGQVDRALAGLISDGTVERLQKKWLTTNLESLRVLR